jgi:ribose 5-phosphate isomerase B
MMRVGIGSDHGGFLLKEQVAKATAQRGYEVRDFGAHQLNAGDDYPDYIIPLAQGGRFRRGRSRNSALRQRSGRIHRANKVAGVRAGLIHDVFSAHQGVEDDDMNVFSLGGQVIGPALAWELIETFLKASFSGAERHQRRVNKVRALEQQPIVRQH